MVPMAEKAVPMTPRMVLKMDWMTAKMEPMIAVMALKIEEIREPRLSRREGIVWFCCLIWGEGVVGVFYQGVVRDDLIGVSLCKVRDITLRWSIYTREGSGWSELTVYVRACFAW